MHVAYLHILNMHELRNYIATLCYFNASMHEIVDYCFTYLILILCKYLYQCIQNRHYLMDGLPIFSLNMYKCTYNPGVASMHCVQQLCEQFSPTI